jgi:hypothetical protein
MTDPAAPTNDNRYWRRGIRVWVEDRGREVTRIWRELSNARYYAPPPLRLKDGDGWEVPEDANGFEYWAGMTPDAQRQLVAVWHPWALAKRAMLQMDAAANDFHKMTRAIGSRIGERGLGLDARTPKQHVEEQRILGLIVRWTKCFPTSGRLLRAFWYWSIRANVARGKVRAHVKREGLKEAFLGPLAAQGDTRKAQLAAYYSGAWRETSEDGEPLDGRSLTGSDTRFPTPLYGTAYYTGPRCDCVFLSTEPKDWARVPADYRVGSAARMLVGAFGVRHPEGGWALAFPHRTQPGRFWRARWDGEGYVQPM